MSDSTHCQSIELTATLRKHVLLAHFQGGRLELLDIGMSARESVFVAKIEEGQSQALHGRDVPVARKDTTHLGYRRGMMERQRRMSIRGRGCFSMPSNLKFESLHRDLPPATASGEQTDMPH